MILQGRLVGETALTSNSTHKVGESHGWENYVEGGIGSVEEKWGQRRS